MDIASPRLPEPPRPLLRNLLVCAGWVLGAVFSYAGFLVLELYWNFAEWKPRGDWVTWVLLGWIASTLVALWLLARIGRNRIGEAAAILSSVALLVLGLIAFPAEPLSEGLFGREASSPLWYRGTRTLLMALPLLRLGAEYLPARRAKSSV